MTLRMMGFVTFGFLCAMTFADRVTALQRSQRSEVGSCLRVITGAACGEPPARERLRFLLPGIRNLEKLRLVYL